MKRISKKLLRSESAATRAGQPFFRDPRFLVFFTLIAIGMDSCSLYSTFDAVLKTNVAMTISLTAGLSMILNVLPSILGFVLFSDQHLIRKIVICLVIVLIFSLLFCFTFQLRMASSEVVFSEAESDSGINIIVPTDAPAEPEIPDEDTAEPDAATSRMQYLTNLIMGLEPLLTSVACLILSCLSDNRAARYSSLKKQEVRLTNLASDLECQIQQLERASAIGVLEREEENRFATVKKSDAHLLDHLRSRSKIILATHQGNARALSYLTRKT